MMPNKKQDELIFDFLEGNLSVEEQEAFRILKDESEVLSREVRLWQNTYLKEPLPSIKALEETLLRHHADNTSFIPRLYSIGIILLASLIVSSGRIQPQAITLERHVATVLSNIDLPSDAAIHADMNPTTSECIELQRVSPETSSVQVMDQTVFEKHWLAVPSFTMKEVQVDADLLSTPKVTFTKPRIIPAQSQGHQNLRGQKKWSRQEVRMLRKKLRNDENQRKANEFLKGNVPYVVPLKNNNF